jgi:hypothetical protein
VGRQVAVLHIDLNHVTGLPRGTFRNNDLCASIDEDGENLMVVLPRTEMCVSYLHVGVDHYFVDNRVSASRAVPVRYLKEQDHVVWRRGDYYAPVTEDQMVMIYKTSALGERCAVVALKDLLEDEVRAVATVAAYATNTIMEYTWSINAYTHRVVEEILYGQIVEYDKRIMVGGNPLLVYEGSCDLKVQVREDDLPDDKKADAMCAIQKLPFSAVRIGRTTIWGRWALSDKTWRKQVD